MFLFNQQIRASFSRFFFSESENTNQLYGRNYESDFEFLMARHVTKTLYKYSLTPRTTP